MYDDSSLPVCSNKFMTCCASEPINESVSSCVDYFSSCMKERKKGLPLPGGGVWYRRVIRVCESDEGFIFMRSEVDVCYGRDPCCILNEQ